MSARMCILVSHYFRKLSRLIYARRTNPAHTFTYYRMNLSFIARRSSFWFCNTLPYPFRLWILNTICTYILDIVSFSYSYANWIKVVLMNSFSVCRFVRTSHKKYKERKIWGKKNIECIFSDYGAIRESVSISVFMWTVWHMHKTTRVFLLTSSYFPSKLFTILIDWNGKPLKIIFIYFTYLFSFHTNNNGFFVVLLVVEFSEAPRNSLIYWALKQGNFEKNFKEIETLNTLNPVCTWLNNFFHK